MKSLFLAFVLMGISTQSFAGAITDMAYDIKSQLLKVEVAFEGQTNQHHFDLTWQDLDCLTVDGVQSMAATLTDDNGTEIGDKTFTQVLAFNLTNMYCKPSDLTVRMGRSHATIHIE